MDASKIRSFLVKAENIDKDERFMAISDLMHALDAYEGKLDTTQQTQIRDTIIKVLDDKSADVQTIAVSCLSVVVKKFESSKVLEIVDKISRNLLDGPADLRDIYATGVKTVITAVPKEYGSGIAAKLCECLAQAARQPSTTIHMQLIVLDITKDLLSRFGTLTDNDTLLNITLPLLDSNKVDLRKRASVTLGSLASVIGDKQFKTLIDNLIAKISAESGNNETLYTYIQTVGVICRHAGVRIGRYLGSIVPLLERFCAVQAAPSNSTDLETFLELRENCLQAFESIIVRCPREVQPHLSNIVTLALHYMKFDPNYSYDNDQSMQDSEDAGWDDDIADFGDNTDDDDTSWKVRRAAVKVLAAINDEQYLARFMTEFTQRIKERTPLVQLEILLSLSHLIRSATATALQPFTNNLISTLMLQYASADQTARVSICSVLRELALQSKWTNEQLSSVVPKLAQAAAERDNALKFAALNCLRLLGESNSLAAHVNQIVPSVISASKDSYTKTKAEALTICGLLAPIARAHAAALFQAVHAQLILQDVDHEVKSSAIGAAAALLAASGDTLKADQSNALPIFLARLRNEVTRQAAMQGLMVLAAAKVDLRLILSDCVTELCALLRKHSQALKHSCVSTLSTLIQAHGADIAPASLQTVIQECAALIRDEDLLLSTLIFDLTSQVLRVQPTAIALIMQDVYPRVLTLLRSPLLQGAVLVSLCQTIGLLAASSGATLMQSLLSAVTPDLSKPSFHAIAQCVAVVSASNVNSAVSVFIQHAQDQNAPIHVKRLALLALGEIGKSNDLSSLNQLTDILVSTFAHVSDDVKNAAAFALGNVSAGSLTRFVPALLQLTVTQSDRLYLILLSLKELISATDQLQPFLAQLLPLLFKHCDNGDEGIRAIVSECLGKLVSLNDALIVPQMLQLLSASPFVRSCMIAAVKFVTPRPNNATFAQSLTKFFALLNDSDIHVKRQAFLTLNSMIHSHYALVAAQMPAYLPAVYKETVVHPELIREVDLGPFTRKIDDGFPLRKAAFQILDTYFDVCGAKVGLPEFVRCLHDGMNDDEKDVQLLTYQILYKIATVRGPQLLEVVEDLPPHLTKGITKKIKESKESEPERVLEILRSSVRCLHAIHCIPGSELCEKFHTFYGRVLQTALLKDMLAQQLKDA